MARTLIDESTQYHCASQSWDPSGAVPYESVSDFLTMCRNCHGEEPDLIERADGCWYELGTGELVLEPLTDRLERVGESWEIALSPASVATYSSLAEALAAWRARGHEVDLWAVTDEDGTAWGYGLTDDEARAEALGWWRTNHPDGETPDELPESWQARVIEPGRLIDYASGEILRDALPEEHLASVRAAAEQIGGGSGAIVVDGRSCYVD